VSARAEAFPGLAPGVSPRREARPRPWVQGYVAFLLLCQVVLLFPDVGPIRLLVRMSAFGASLLLLLVLRGRGAAHPAAPAALLALVVVLVAVFNPDTTNLIAGGAQAALYTAVLAPLFWVPRTSPTSSTRCPTRSSPR